MLGLGLGLSLTGSSVAAFSPLSLFTASEKGGWYDPSDLSTMFQNSNGTTAVAADGDPVGYIADKSGNGNHLIQATAGNRPTYKTSGGLHWLSFDGGDSLSIASATFGSSATLTICLPMAFSDTSGGDGIYKVGAAAGYAYAYGFNANITGFLNDATNSSRDDYSTVIDGADQLFTFLHDFGAGTVAGKSGLRVGGAAQADGSSGTAATGSFADGVITLGSAPDAGVSLTGKIYGAVVRTGATPAALADLETYMGAKAGLVI